MATNITARQRALAAVIDNNIAVDSAAATAVFTVKLPPGAYLTSMLADTITAWNAATTNTLTCSDGTNTIINGVDIKSAGLETVASLAGRVYPSGGTLTFTFAQTGAAATAGRSIIVVQYVAPLREDEKFG